MKLTSEEARKILEKARLEVKDDKFHKYEISGYNYMKELGYNLYDLFPEIKENL